MGNSHIFTVAVYASFVSSGYSRNSWPTRTVLRGLAGRARSVGPASGQRRRTASVLTESAWRLTRASLSRSGEISGPSGAARPASSRRTAAFGYDSLQPNDGLQRRKNRLALPRTTWPGSGRMPTATAASSSKRSRGSPTSRPRPRPKGSVTRRRARRLQKATDPPPRRRLPIAHVRCTFAATQIAAAPRRDAGCRRRAGSKAPVAWSETRATPTLIPGDDQNDGELCAGTDR
jgi:hypothetical protein